MTYLPSPRSDRVRYFPSAFISVFVLSIGVLPKGDLRSPRDPFNSLSPISHEGDRQMLQLQPGVPVGRNERGRKGEARSLSNIVKRTANCQPPTANYF
jgi:hypothetical protein